MRPQFIIRQVLSLLFVILCSFPVEGILNWGWGGKTRSSHNIVVAPPTPSPTAAHLSPNVFHRQERDKYAESLWKELEAKGLFSPCWKSAVAEVRVRCGSSRLSDHVSPSKPFSSTPLRRELLESSTRDEDQRSRLSFRLAQCDAETDGRSPHMFFCREESDIRRCIQGLSDGAYVIFVQYRLHADILCAYLREEVFQQRTEAAVSALHEEAKATVHSLQTMESIESEVLKLSKENMKLYNSSRESLEGMRDDIVSIETVQQRMLAATEASSREILEQSNVTTQLLHSLRNSIAEQTEFALASIATFANATTLQYAYIQEITENLADELTRVEVAQNAFLKRSIKAKEWLLELCGGVIVLLLTSFSRTAAARFRALCLWTLGVLLPYGLGALPRCAFLSNRMPFFLMGFLSSIACIAARYFASSRQLCSTNLQPNSLRSHDDLCVCRRSPTPLIWERLTDAAAVSGRVTPQSFFSDAAHYLNGTINGNSLNEEKSEYAKKLRPRPRRMSSIGDSSSKTRKKRKT